MSGGDALHEPKACVICTNPKEARHGLLCPSHFDRLSTMLREIEDESIMLSAVPSMAVQTGAGGGSLPSQRAPARLDALVLTDTRTSPYNRPDPGPACIDCQHGLCKAIRAWENAVNARATEGMSILETLHGWARVVREDRDLTPPAHLTITGERDLLTRQLEYVAEQAWVDECFADLRKLLGQVKAINGSNEIRPKPVGICPTLFDDGECGGRLWANDQDGEVVCDLCGRTFGPAELRHLGDMLIGQGYVEVFRAEWFTGVPAGTIRRWVAEQRCTSQKDGRKLMVQIREIQQLKDRGKRRAKGVAS